jgi:putative transposase
VYVFFQIVLFAWAFALDLVAVCRLADDVKAVEILLLRQQLRIAERRQRRGPHIQCWQKISLAVLVQRLKETTVDAQRILVASVRLFRPETVLNWHREAVRPKWTFKHKQAAGRPRTSADIEASIIRMTHENPRWGYDRIQGELCKPGVDLDRTPVANIMKRHGIPPVPQRGHSTWRAFLNHYRDQMLACDFFTIETMGLKTL